MTECPRCAARLERPPKAIERRETALGQLTVIKRLILDTVLDEARTEYGVQEDELLSKSKTRRIVRAREYVAWRLRQLTDLSYPQMAKILGGNHSSYILAARRYERDHPQEQPT